MNSLVNTKKQAQFKKFTAKDTSFLKKVIGGNEDNKTKPVEDKIKL